MAPINPDRFKRPTLMDKISIANVIVSCSNDGIEVIKNRFGDPKDYCTLPASIGLLVYSYLNLDLTYELTPSAMMNIPIKKDLEKAMFDVLVKHGIMK